MPDDGPRLVPRFMQAGAAATPAATPARGDQTSDGDREHAPRTVRPFVVTRGRTRVDADLRLESQIVRSGTAVEVDFESAALLDLLDERAMSIAEASAYLHIPVGAVKVLVSDLADSGAVLVSQPQTTATPSTIRELIDAVIAL